MDPRHISRHLWCKKKSSKDFCTCKTKLTWSYFPDTLFYVITHNQTSVVLKKSLGKKKNIKSITRKRNIRKGKKIFSLANHDKRLTIWIYALRYFFFLLKNCFFTSREDRSGLLYSPWFLFTFPLFCARSERAQRIF